MRRIWILGLCGLLISWQSMNANISPVSAALPPLSKDRLLKDSSHIIVTKVRDISKVKVQTGVGENFTNYNYSATVEVLKIDKSPQSKSSPPLSAGKVIQVQYWQAEERPAGWVGPGGQRPGLKVGTKVRLFLKQDAQGKLNLLDPNGSELLPQK
jgi:hypothetical protein